MPKSTKQVAALLTFPLGVTRLQVIELFSEMGRDMRKDNSEITWDERFETKEFDPDWGDVTICQP